DFLPDEWLIELVRKQGELVALPIRGYGYHIYQAFPGKAKQGYASYWHDHNDIGAHTTLAGAGLEWLPSHIKTKDAATHPEKFEHLIQRVEIGDLIVFGRLPHRSSHAIPEQGQFAVLGQGPFDLRNGD